MRNARGQSGQVIAIYAISLLLITFMTFLTIAIGVRVREKIKVESAADAAAYGLAVAESRTLNTMAWANRAIVAEYVSMLSVVGHESFINAWENTLKLQADLWTEQIATELDAECALVWLVECFEPACNCISAAYRIGRMWKKDGFTNGSGCPNGSGGLGSYDCAHSMWHKGSMAKNFHQALTMMDRGYIGFATLARLQGTQAYLRYLTMMDGSFAEGLGKAIDPAIKKGAAASPASFDQFKRAVQAHPAGQHPGLKAIASEDWDVYHEILTGTRTDWILQHDWADGYFMMDKLKQFQLSSQCGAPFSYATASDSGGGMVMKGEKSRVLPVNHGKDHHYNQGGATGEGGRHAASAEDHGDTEAFIYPGGCAFGAGYGSNGQGDNFQFQDPNVGCDKHSFHKAGDGWDDGGSNSGANHIWDAQNNIGGGQCGDPGPGIVVGWFRFDVVKDDSEAVLFNQPRTYASLKLDVPKGPWDFDVGAIRGSLLTIKGYQSHSEATVRGFSTGMSYYHNRLAWQEAPNLWNPFWRAKLDRPFGSAKDLALISKDDKKIGDLLGEGSNGAVP